MVHAAGFAARLRLSARDNARVGDGIVQEEAVFPWIRHNSLGSGGRNGAMRVCGGQVCRFVFYSQRAASWHDRIGATVRGKGDSHAEAMEGEGLCASTR